MTARRLLAAAGVLLSLTGCSSSTGTAGEAASSTPSTAHEHSELHVDEPTSAPSAERDPAAAVRRFIAAWSRPDLPYPQWWAGLRPLLSPQGLQAYASTDPAVVPRLKVTGELEVVPSTVDTSTLVWASTSSGRFGFQLSRVSGVSAWKVSRIYFPGTGPAVPAGGSST